MLNIIKYNKIKNSLINESKELFKSISLNNYYYNNIYLIHYTINLIENKCKKKMNIQDKIHFFFLVYENEFKNLNNDDYIWIDKCLRYIYERNIFIKKKNEKWYSFNKWLLLKSIRYGKTQIEQYILPVYLTAPLYTLHIKHTIIHIIIALGMNKIATLIIVGFLFA
uniref:Uncharacterized protein n=1 Tax=viral metagenome TaxID=1070528 RepID=A0A6C0H666_9ZZZZ